MTGRPYTPASLAEHLDQNFAMDEAAAWLRISRRALQDLVKRHPFYFTNGNRKLFGEGDLIALREAMRREGEKCRSSLSRHVPARRRTTMSGGRTSADLWTRAQRLLSGESPPESFNASKLKSRKGSSPAEGRPRS